LAALDTGALVAITGIVSGEITVLVLAYKFGGRLGSMQSSIDDIKKSMEDIKGEVGRLEGLVIEHHQDFVKHSRNHSA